MKTRTSYTLLPFVLFAIQFQSFSQELEFNEEKGGILLRENNQPRFFYQVAPKSEDGKYVRAGYIHPLYGLNGEILTEDFPDDHPHHHGIFWSWHQLYAKGKRIGDPWLSEGIDWEVDNTSAKIKNGIASLKAEVSWKQQSEEKALLKENLHISYQRLAKSVFSLTFKIRLTALEDGVAIGGSEDEKGYGGFSPRLKLPEDIVFSDFSGKVEPQNLAVQAGPWINLSGHFDPAAKDASGIVIMGEPEKLPSYQGWILRSAKSMQNMAFPGKNPISIKKGESLEFRHQILVHRDLSPDEISHFYDKFKEANNP